MVYAEPNVLALHMLPGCCRPIQPTQLGCQKQRSATDCQFCLRLKIDVQHTLPKLTSQWHASIRVMRSTLRYVSAAPDIV
eukprot:scaffold227311_cov37-Prasinocladus_malaysianus.AAC.1